MDPDPDSDPNPAVFVIGLQDANKTLIYKKVFLPSTFWRCTFTSFFKYKKSKRSHKTVGIKVCITIFCLMVEGSRSEFISLTNDPDLDPGEAQKRKYPTDSNPDSDPDSDPPHWF